MTRSVSVIARRTPAGIIVSGQTYAIRIPLKSIIGTVWDKAAKHWVMPLAAEASLVAACDAAGLSIYWPDAAEDAATGTPPPPPPVTPVTPVTPAGDTAPPTPAPTPATAPPGSLEGRIIELIREHAAPAGTSGVDRETVLAVVQEAMAEYDRPRQLVVTIGATTHATEGLAHKSLDLLIRCLSARLHVWLAGPSGSGKTHAAEQAAQALGLSFELQGAMTMAHELVGFVDAAGRYHETPFVRAYSDGGLILLDEIDAGSNEALLALNAALANGVMSLPTGEVVRAHADFRCIGAANTYGSGATHDYVGRTRIDAAFLQRFGAAIQWDYDEKLETAMSGNPEWSKRVQRVRKRAVKAGLKILVTPRASIAGARLIAAGMSEDEAAKLTYLRGLTPDQVMILEE